jgi:type IV pilus assembly protein PilC
MATSGESKSGPKRIRRTTRKTTKVDAAAPAMADEDVVMHGMAPPSTSIFQRGSVRSKDITAFLQQLIMLLDAGTPILKSLRTLAGRGQRPAARALVADIAQYVEAGNPLWQSFDRHPRYFDSVFVNLIKASEASGTLTTVLRRVSKYREERELMTKRVRGAMLYPVMLVTACLGALLLITKLVVPAFQDMFDKANITYPPSTKFFFQISELFGNWWWLPIVGIVVLVLVYRTWYVRSPVRRLVADKFKLRIPVVGPILHKSAIVELTQTMSMLLSSGLSMMATLDLTRNAIRNRAVAQSLQGVRDSIEQGGGMEEPLRQASNVVPPVVTDMFVTGEEAGRVDAITEQIARVYDEEVRISVGTLGEALLPIFTIIIGVAVLFLFIALFLPMVSMMQSLTDAGV